MQSGHSGEEKISCPCQETNRYSLVVQSVAHLLHPMSYSVLSIIVYVWQPHSQLSSSHSGQLEPRKMNGAHPRGGAYKLQPPDPPQNIEIKKKL